MAEDDVRVHLAGLSISSAQPVAGGGSGGKTPPVFVDTEASCRDEITRLLDAQTDVAVDVEGVSLCRDGRVCLIQLAGPDPSTPVVLVDIVAIGEAAFAGGRLRELLESKTVTKIIFDPRY